MPQEQTEPTLEKEWRKREKKKTVPEAAGAGAGTPWQRVSSQL